MLMKTVFRASTTAIFWFGCLFVAISSMRFLVAPLSSVMPHMVHYVPSAPLALYAHVFGAPLALALAPFQIWQGLRGSRPALHRMLGYIYVVAVVLAGMGSLAMLPHFLGTSFAAAGFAFMALGWIGFTLRGVWLACRKDYIAHRQFMLRSVAFTFSAFTLRLIMTPLLATGWSVVETYQITAWAAWVPNLIVVELWIRLRANNAQT
jgi:uncharacterized membrane protein